MVGNRLMKFLSSILPTHRDYFSDDNEPRKARDRSQEQLVLVLKYLDQIAILVDKQEHEDFISSVLDEAAEQHETSIEVSLGEAVEVKDDSCLGHRDSSVAYTGDSESTDRLDNTTITTISTMRNYKERSLGTISGLLDNDAISMTSSSMKRRMHATPENSILASSCTGESSAATSSLMSKAAAPPLVIQPRPRKAKTPRASPPPKHTTNAYPPPSPLVRSYELHDSLNDNASETEDASMLANSEDSTFRVVSPDSFSESDAAKTSSNLSNNRGSRLPQCLDLPPKASSPEKPQQSPSKKAPTESSRAQRPQTPLPLEQNTIAASSPKREPSPETVHLKFQPMDDFQRQAAAEDKRSPFKQNELNRSAPRATLPKDSSIGPDDEGVSSYISNTDSEKSQEMQSLFKYSKIDTSAQQSASKTSSSTKEPIRSTDETISDQWQEAYVRNNIQETEQRKKSTDYAPAAADWSADDGVIVGVVGKAEIRNDDWMDGVSVGTSQFDPAVKGAKVDNPNGNCKSSLHESNVTPAAARSTTTQDPNVSTDSSGFPKLTKKVPAVPSSSSPSLFGPWGDTGRKELESQPRNGPALADTSTYGADFAGPCCGVSGKDFTIDPNNASADSPDFPHRIKHQESAGDQQLGPT